MQVVVVGGGAAGYFTAITAAEADPTAQVVILEQSKRVLHKVSISGGGRCNVTHDCLDPKQLVNFYPRGYKELIGPFHRWQPADTIAWFEERGVQLKVEADGRMFPVTDDSQTIVDCLTGAARAAGVATRLQCGLVAVRRLESGFQLALSDGKSLQADKLVLAAGGTRAGKVVQLAESLGHQPVPPVPSLFSLRTRDPRLADLAGVSQEKVTVAYQGPRECFTQSGPLLITHEGFSGPAVLKLSAWAAREFAAVDYTTDIQIDWTAGTSDSELQDRFQQQRQAQGKRQVKNTPLCGSSQRLWERLVEAAGIPADRKWLEMKKAEQASLMSQLLSATFHIRGKSLNKDEFVTCGGIPTQEVDFRTMESKCCPGLYFAGEILNIDGVTGGFNFQAAWTTGHLAGSAVIKSS
ncbi:MAG: NAD(P)/FAD-dependent oxidoreductase [Verrucomicrobiota bacterium]